MEFDDDLLDDENINSYISFPIEVQNAIEQVLPSSDPLDRPDFNAVDYINTLFPTEQSLSSIDDVIGRMKLKVRQLDDEIRTVIRGQTNTNQDGQQALEEAQHAIQELFSKIRDIKDKAEKSETMVKEITRDIKQLDYAKRSLTTSILTLNKLHMLVEGVEKLQTLVKEHQYGQIANLLQGVTNVIDEFEKYRNIPQIAKLADTTQGIKTELTEQITKDLHNAFAGPDSKNFCPGPDVAEAFLVVAILDPKVKNNLLKWFVSKQLEEYGHLFEESEKIAWLDEIGKRYNWLKKNLMQFEEKFGKLFPLDWHVSERIAVEFCHMTWKSLVKIMQVRRAEMNVQLLLFAIQKTKSFEALLARRFTGTTLEIPAIVVPEKKQNTVENIGANPFEETNVDESNPFHEDMVNEESSIDNTETAVSKEQTSQLEPNANPFDGIISQCFEAHLTIYVDFQEKNLTKLMEGFVEDSQKAAPPRPDIDSSCVLQSCGELFIFYKECLVHCTKLSTGQPMLALAMTFKKFLCEYASKILQSTLPKGSISQTSTNLIQSFLKDGDVIKFTHSEQIQICSILTTADYCLETTQQLGEKLKEKIDPALSGQINFTGEQDIFHAVISQCIQLLVQNLESACEPGLTTMTKIQWSQVETVGDQSTYVSAIQAHIRQTIPLLRENLKSSRKYFTQFCMKFANSFIPKWVSHLFKCKPISPVGAEQLLLDTHMLKTELLDLPSLGSVVVRKPPATYTKIVVKGMTKAEMILKVVMAPHDNQQKFVENYTKLLPEADLLEFQKVLDMKGLKRSEQNVMTELFRSQQPPPGMNQPQTSSEANTQSNSAVCSPEHASSRIRKLEKLIMRH